MNREPPDYYDTTYEAALRAGFDLVQLKYDGIYGRAVLSASGTVVYSKNNKPKANLSTLFEPGGDIRGEYMFGSHWAQDESRKGKLYLFDIASVGGEDLTSLPYVKRSVVLRSLLTEIAHPELSQVETFPISEYQRLWESEVSTGRFEGVVFRKSFATWDEPLGRQKSVVTRDFVCTGFYEGEGKHKGRLGGIVCSRATPGGLVEVCKVGGGFSDTEREEIWANRDGCMKVVAEVRGMKEFVSGALRHPIFVRWHPEKQVKDCV